MVSKGISVTGAGVDNLVEYGRLSVDGVGFVSTRTLPRLNTLGNIDTSQSCLPMIPEDF